MAPTGLPKIRLRELSSVVKLDLTVQRNPGFNVKDFDRGDDGQRQGHRKEYCGRANNSPQAMTESRLTTGGRDVASDWMIGVIKLPSMKCTATYLKLT